MHTLQIRDRVDGLAQDPGRQGKALVGEMAGYRCLRAAGQRYRLIYHIDEDRVVGLVVAIGICNEAGRSDIYALARKMLRLRLLEPEAGYAAGEGRPAALEMDACDMATNEQAPTG